MEQNSGEGVSPCCLKNLGADILLVANLLELEHVLFLRQEERSQIYFDKGFTRHKPVYTLLC